MKEAFSIVGARIAPGTRETVSLPVPRLYTHAELDIPVHVVHGRRPGPRLFVSAAVHGDEINGVEIIRRLLRLKILEKLRGTLIAVPVVNVFGFINQSRYLPDRRDLNRSFPGSHHGSLAARMARLFADEIVGLATHGIDLHTGSNHRTNLPQIRASLDDPETAGMAHAFGAPVILDSTLRDGSLRQAGFDRKLPMLLYEAGEALRFNELAIRTGMRGIVGVMRSIGMLRHTKKSRAAPTLSTVARSSYWQRAPISGVLHGSVRLGTEVAKGQKIANIADPLGNDILPIRAASAGVVIGRLMLPLVHQGDALLHIARLDRPLATAKPAG
ncbi:MAG: succinylglutamate desuccinylase/aspartoacylase family protein [Acidobacteriota bacterium]|nr:succinylglutamate desuccinylase/aspartoacylase family protein [Acidobacteriota bacterium]MDH3523161.1 succinylglutamate desuccinylase/aspartoacylase family protein [Acidobacteriota bacterium]